MLVGFSLIEMTGPWSAITWIVRLIGGIGIGIGIEDIGGGIVYTAVLPISTDDPLNTRLIGCIGIGIGSIGIGIGGISGGIVSMSVSSDDPH